MSSWVPGDVLAEVDEAGTGRLLMDGEEPFEEHARVGRVCALAPDTTQSDYDYDGQPDSTAKLRLPSPDIDDGDLHSASIWAACGPKPIVLIANAEALPEEELRRLVRACVRGMSPGEGETFEDVEHVAETVRHEARWVLDYRIRMIEKSVRDALADDDLSDDDYLALREYPQRLAKVEQLAVAIQAVESTWSSLRPPLDALSLAVRPPVVDMFDKWASETEADAKASVARISGLVATQQVAMGMRQRLEVERLQRTVTIVGAAVLVPGMIAAVFGANVNVPGEETSAGFLAMLLFMAAGGVGSFAALRVVEQGDEVSKNVRAAGGLTVVLAAAAVVLLVI